MGKERLGDFSSTLFIPLLSPSSLAEALLRRGCPRVGAGVLMVMGWRRRGEPEEQAGDAGTGDQRSLCIS